MSRKIRTLSGCYHRVCRNLIINLCGGGISIIMLTLALALSGCSKDTTPNPDPDPIPSNRGKGLFVLNEGNFLIANASISYYNFATQAVDVDVFSSANGGAPLGDAATSMVIRKGLGYITLSNSGKIYIIDPDTGVLKGKITGLNSPRYIHFLSDTKAYVTNINSNQIDIINPESKTITGSINLGDKANCGEQMVEIGGYIYTNCWSYNNKILRIDPSKDLVVDELTVGLQPASICADSDNMLWVYTDGGGWEENPVGYETSKLERIDPQSWSVKTSIEFGKGALSGGKLMTDKAGSNIFYLVDNSLYRMPIASTEKPAAAIVSSSDKFFYSYTVDKETGNIYMADAADYQAAGTIYRYDSAGKELGSFAVGIIPGSFCFN